MRELIKQALSPKGSISMTRLVCLICTCTSVLIAFIGMATHMSAMDIVALVGTFLGPALTAKVIQHKSE